MRRTILLASLAILGVTHARADIVISIFPAVQTVSSGSTVTAQVTIAGLGAQMAPSLGAYDLDISFDPALLSFNSLSFGDPLLGDQLDLSGSGAVSGSTLSPGLVELFEISLDPTALLDAQQLDQFVLATLAFDTSGAGTSSLLLSVNSVGDAGGAPLAVGLQSGIIQVATPEPNAFFALFLLTALVAGACARKRLRAASH